MIWVGTSGFQYPEWKGSFYPPTLSLGKMLSFYARYFSTIEINYSFRRIPSVKTLANWSAATPETFRFSLKAPREITHIRKLRNCAQFLSRFCEALENLNEKLGPVLFQLPPFFQRDVTLLKEFLALLPPRLKSVFEFRHASWFTDETFAALKSKNAALCVAESKDLTIPVVFTGDFGYFRLRRTDYTPEDIARWTSTIAAQRMKLEDIYVYFKHEESAMGPRLAKQLADALA